jgi:hypothetical protein
MESVIAQIISAISPSALPIVVCVLGLAWIYWKINSQRKQTKTERDIQHDDLVARVKILEREIEDIKQLDLSAKLAQILTELAWIKDRLKENDK